MKFPSREWCEAAAAAMLSDPEVVAALADFGPAVAGVVIERGGGLRSDFCVLARIEPGRPAKLSYPDDEDELEEYQPDYLAQAPYPFCRALLEQAAAGQRPDLLRAILERRIRLQGDLQRLVRHAGRHRGAGLQALRAIRTEFV
ncbi:MAG TPA: hypothetical protein VN928_04480 [Myxococcales bacterium]|nr:hypothetical protein [Myxococcales bacterium]